MKKPLLISLKGGDRIYINGAAIRVDRRVTLELLNEVAFLLQQHVLRPEEATTPLRQLYFLVQSIVLDPREANAARGTTREVLAELARTRSSVHLQAGLAEVAQLIDRSRWYDALRSIRSLYAIEPSGPTVAPDRAPEAGSSKGSCR